MFLKYTVQHVMYVIVSLIRQLVYLLPYLNPHFNSIKLDLRDARKWGWYSSSVFSIPSQTKIISLNVKCGHWDRMAGNRRLLPTAVCLPVQTEDIEGIYEMSFSAMIPDSASCYQSDGADLLRNLVVMRLCFTCYHFTNPPWYTFTTARPNTEVCNPDKKQYACWKSIARDYAF